MPDTDSGEKSQPASPRKKQKAREKGNVARSQDLNAAWTLTVALVLLTFLGTRMFHAMLEATGYYFGGLSTITVTSDTMQWFSLGVLYRLGYVLLPFMVIMMLAGVSVNLAQVGFLFTTEPLTPKLDKLNVIKGFKKFFNIRTFAELVKSIFKLVIVGTIVYVTLRNRWDIVQALPYLTPLLITKALADVVFAVWLRVVIAMLILGGLDYAFQWWRRNEELRMTIQETKEELKEMEGDPQIRRRVRDIQRQMAYQRMMAEVPTADVIVTNPTEYAVALRYDMVSMDAPIVIAKGARLVAARIRDIGIEHRVPIVEKPELARTLYRTIDLGQAIPEGLFRVVAEVLAFVYEIDRRADKIRERAAAATAMSRAAA
jgi:flagellar biosynthetic protein FlhB